MQDPSQSPYARDYLRYVTGKVWLGKPARPIGQYVNVRAGKDRADTAHTAMVQDLWQALGCKEERGHKTELYRETTLGPRYPDIGNNLIGFGMEAKAGMPRVPEAYMQNAKEVEHLEDDGVGFFVVPDAKLLQPRMQQELSELSRRFPDQFFVVERTPENRDRVDEWMRAKLRSLELAKWQERKVDLSRRREGLQEEIARQQARIIEHSREMSQRNIRHPRNAQREAQERNSLQRQLSKLVEQEKKLTQQLQHAQSLLPQIQQELTQARSQIAHREQLLTNEVERERARVVRDYIARGTPEYARLRQAFETRDKELAAQLVPVMPAWGELTQQPGTQIRPEIARNNAIQAERAALAQAFAQEIQGIALEQTPVVREQVQARMERTALASQRALADGVTQIRERMNELAQLVEVERARAKESVVRETCDKQRAALSRYQEKLAELARTVDPQAYSQLRDQQSREPETGRPQPATLKHGPVHDLGTARPERQLAEMARIAQQGQMVELARALEQAAIAPESRAVLMQDALDNTRAACAASHLRTAGEREQDRQRELERQRNDSRER